MISSNNSKYVLEKYLNDQLFEVPIFNYYLEKGINGIYNDNLSYDEVFKSVTNFIIKIFEKYIKNNQFNAIEFNDFFKYDFNKFIQRYENEPPKKLLKK